MGPPDQSPITALAQERPQIPVLAPQPAQQTPLMDPKAAIWAHTAAIHNPVLRTLGRISGLAGTALTEASPAGQEMLKRESEANTKLMQAQHQDEITQMRLAHADELEKLKEQARTALEAQKETGASNLQGEKGEQAKEREQMQIDATNYRQQQALKTQADKLAQQAQQFKESEAFKKWQTEFNAQTKKDIAANSQNKAPAQILQTGMYAAGAQRQIADAQQGLEQLRNSGVLGSVTSDKLEDWLFGSGLIDPTLSDADKRAIGKLRAALSYTSSATMRAHTGRSSREIYEDIKKTTGLGQSYEALEGALDQTNALLQDYVDGASDTNIQQLRTGTTPTARPHSTHKVGSSATHGRAVMVNGKIVGYTTDGKTMIPVGNQ